MPSSSLVTEEEPGDGGGWSLNPTAPELASFVCHRKRHSYQVVKGMTLAVGITDGHQQWASSNLCPLCFVEWFSQMFPTQEV